MRKTQQKIGQKILNVTVSVTVDFIVGIKNLEVNYGVKCRNYYKVFNLIFDHFKVGLYLENKSKLLTLSEIHCDVNK